MLVAEKDPNAQEVALPELFVDEPSIWEDNRALLVDLVELGQSLGLKSTSGVRYEAFA